MNDPWPMLKGTVHPADKSDFFAKLRVHPHELTGNHLQPFVEKMAEIDQTQDRRLMSIAKIIGDCTSIHSAATYIMDNEEWDFMSVYYDAIDHFCHGFMKYHPPRRPHIPMKDYELYKDVVNSGCRYHDMMLGAMMDMVDEDTNIILVSDHGFHPDHNRPTALPKEPAGPALEHSPYGIIVMNGPNVKKDDTIFGASLLDITPTILSMYDMPVAEDMDGKVLVNAFETSPEIKTIKSWENIKGEDGSHSKDMEISEEDAQAELQQLIELGYIEDPGENGSVAVKSTVDENNYNLARSYIDGQQWE
ncbi:MAG: alkaline phosphatase family protein, partial [Saprospiraceae bacterium]